MIPNYHIRVIRGRMAQAVPSCLPCACTTYACTCCDYMARLVPVDNIYKNPQSLPAVICQSLGCHALRHLLSSRFQAFATPVLCCLAKD